MRFNKILCVCTGNICRSPLAEGYLRKKMPGLTVASAGIGAVVGGQMPAEAQAIAQREQLDLTEHRGQQITTPLAKAFDLIIVMEKRHLNWIVERIPLARGRVFLATHWNGRSDVDDPYRHGAEFFDRVYQEMSAGLECWVRKIQSMS